MTRREAQAVFDQMDARAKPDSTLDKLIRLLERVNKWEDTAQTTAVRATLVDAIILEVRSEGARNSKPLK